MHWRHVMDVMKRLGKTGKLKIALTSEETYDLYHKLGLSRKSFLKLRGHFESCNVLCPVPSLHRIISEERLTIHKDMFDVKTVKNADGVDVVVAQLSNQDYLDDSQNEAHSIYPSSSLVFSNVLPTHIIPPPLHTIQGIAQRYGFNFLIKLATAEDAEHHGTVAKANAIEKAREEWDAKNEDCRNSRFGARLDMSQLLRSSRGSRDLRCQETIEEPST